MRGESGGAGDVVEGPGERRAERGGSDSEEFPVRVIYLFFVNFLLRITFFFGERVVFVPSLCMCVCVVFFFCFYVFYLFCVFLRRTVSVVPLCVFVVLSCGSCFCFVLFFS